MGWVESGGRLEAGGSCGRIYAPTLLRIYASRRRQHEIRDTRRARLGNRAKQSQLGESGGRRREAPADTSTLLRKPPPTNRAKQSQFRGLRAANGGPGGYNNGFVGVWTENG